MVEDEEHFSFRKYKFDCNRSNGFKDEHKESKNVSVIVLGI